jgi:hypothetical protein
MLRIGIILAAMLLLASCSDKHKEERTSPAPHPATPAPSASALASAPASAEAEPAVPKLADYPRAIGDTSFGHLRLVPEEGETSEIIDAPSCISTGSGYRYNGRYHLLYEPAEDRSYDVAQLNLEIVTDSEKPIPIPIIRYGTTNLYYFQPYHNSCRADSIYLFGIDEKVWDAYVIPFDLPEGKSDAFSILPGRKPLFEGQDLILDSVNSDNQPTRYHFRTANLTSNPARRRIVGKARCCCTDCCLRYLSFDLTVENPTLIIARSGFLCSVAKIRFLQRNPLRQYSLDRLSELRVPMDFLA